MYYNIKFRRNWIECKRISGICSIKSATILKWNHPYSKICTSSLLWMRIQLTPLVRSPKSIPIPTKETQLRHFSSKITTQMRDNIPVCPLSRPLSMHKKSPRKMISTDQVTRNLNVVLPLWMRISIKPQFSIKYCREDSESRAKMKSREKSNRDSTSKTKRRNRIRVNSIRKYVI